MKEGNEVGGRSVWKADALVHLWFIDPPPPRKRTEHEKQLEVRGAQMVSCSSKVSNASPWKSSASFVEERACLAGSCHPSPQTNSSRSSREVKVRVPDSFSVVIFNRGTLRHKRVKGTTGGPSHIGLCQNVVGKPPKGDTPVSTIRVYCPITPLKLNSV